MRHEPRTCGRATLVGFAFIAATAATPAIARQSDWTATWAASPQRVWGREFAFPTRLPSRVYATTFRQNVRISLGGRRLRLTFSNAYGSAPVRIGAATVGVAGPTATSAIRIRRITFGGRRDLVIAPGASVVSDAVDLRVAARTRLSVSTYLPAETPLRTFHWDARDTAWFASGDRTFQARLTPKARTEARILLTGVQVEAPGGKVVAVIGDSTTDGDGATIDVDARWPDFLARRLAPSHVAVVNAGISGNRLLSPGMGDSVVARFDRDVLAQPGVSAVVVMVGINDIAWPGTAFAPAERRPELAAMTAGYRRLAAMAHARGVRVVAATLTPFRGALTGTPLADYYSPAKDVLRGRVNDWLRSSGAFDAVIDFDAALRDPADPTRIAARLDSGDHLHPSDAGNKAMAASVDLASLLGR